MVSGWCCNPRNTGCFRWIPGIRSSVSLDQGLEAAEKAQKRATLRRNGRAEALEKARAELAQAKRDAALQVREAFERSQPEARCTKMIAGFIPEHEELARRAVDLAAREEAARQEFEKEQNAVVAQCVDAGVDPPTLISFASALARTLREKLAGLPILIDGL
ncbi:MAG TPA: hypothetical protein VNO75_10310, partial [Gemmatimonadaceae bacterium]|nr:hypothetical protein [Gemmatimonadaceae bacterium]